MTLKIMKMAGMWKHGTTILRWILAGPVALAVALAVMAAMPLWFPEGAAGIDHLILPTILFPAIWAGAFFYACLSENLRRSSVLLIGVLGINGAAAGWAIWGGA